MELPPGIIEAFQEARVVFLVTYGPAGELRSRQMVNFNSDPSRMLWFTTYTKTRKVDDIKRDPRAIVTFPAKEKNSHYEIYGIAELEKQSVVDEKWVWWYLAWHPEEKDKYWFPHTGTHPERVIINVYPQKAMLVNNK